MMLTNMRGMEKPANLATARNIRTETLGFSAAVREDQLLPNAVRQLRTSNNVQRRPHPSRGHALTTMGVCDTRESR